MAGMIAEKITADNNNTLLSLKKVSLRSNILKPK
jgi:hypothetical protein